MTDSIRFLHTSDWQIGRSFRFADDVTLGVLADARLEAIGAIGRLAHDEGISTVLVAGDVYDVERPTERSLRQPVERMAAFPGVTWHLVPGNHDPDRPGGAWERLLRTGLPGTVVPHLDERPVPIAGAWLLPAVLRERHASGDPTAVFEAMATPAGAVRVGLAHGSARGFGETGESGHNRIAHDRAARSGLAYLALGDWHGAQEVAPRTWYAGTPETDDFHVGGRGGGEVLSVRVEGAAPPAVRPVRVGRFTWHKVEAPLFGHDDVEALAARLRAVAPAPERALVDLAVSGALTLAQMARFEERIGVEVGAALRLLRIDREALSPRPDVADLDAIESSGPLREAAERLSAAAAAGDAAAAAALLRLAHLAREEGAAA